MKNKFIFDAYTYSCYHPESDTMGFSTSKHRNHRVRFLSAYKNCVSQKSFKEWYNENSYNHTTDSNTFTDNS